MATQRRMVYGQLAENKDFAKMSDKAQILYIFMIVLADDEGRLKGDSELLRAKVFPYKPELTVDDMKRFTQEIVKAGLIVWYKDDKNNYYISHPNWEKYQILRADRTKQSSIPLPTDNQVSTKRPRKEVSKLSIKGIGKPESSSEYLKNIPPTDLFEFYQRFDCSKKGLINKAEELYNYCKMHGKVYKDYKLFMLNALKKDFPERAEDHHIRTSKLQEVDGVMKIIPKEMQEEIGKLADKLTIKQDKDNG